MPSYIVLYRFTEQGRRNIKATIARAQAIQQENESRGFRIVGHYWTMGRYDLVAVVNAPSDEEMMAGLVRIASTGNVISETLRGFHL